MARRPLLARRRAGQRQDRADTRTDEANKTSAGKLELFFVKNHINATDYYGWQENPRFDDALKAMQPRMIDVPQLDEIAAESVQQGGQSCSSFVTDSANSRILRGYVSDWMTHVRAEFDRVGIGKAAQSLVR